LGIVIDQIEAINRRADAKYREIHRKGLHRSIQKSIFTLIAQALHNSDLAKKDGRYRCGGFLGIGANDSLARF